MNQLALSFWPQLKELNLKYGYQIAFSTAKKTYLRLYLPDNWSWIPTPIRNETDFIKAKETIWNHIKTHVAGFKYLAASLPLRVGVKITIEENVECVNLGEPSIYDRVVITANERDFARFKCKNKRLIITAISNKTDTVVTIRADFSDRLHVSCDCCSNRGVLFYNILFGKGFKSTDRKDLVSITIGRIIDRSYEYDIGGEVIDVLRLFFMKV